MNKVKAIEKTQFVFSVAYLTACFVMGLYLLFTSYANVARQVAGATAIILVASESVRIIPKLYGVKHQCGEELEPALCRGRQFSAIGTTIFYVFLWRLACVVYGINSLGWLGIIIYIVAAVRVALCITPLDQWGDGAKGQLWKKLRNIPHLVMGVIIAAVYVIYMVKSQALLLMWLVVIINYACYTLMLLFPTKMPQILLAAVGYCGAYIWMIAMCLSL